MSPPAGTVAKLNGSPSPVVNRTALKESNRVFEIQKGLNLMGIKTKATQDSLVIYGNPNLKIKKNIKIFPHLDHRICMSFFILGQALGINMTIKGFESVNSSFPNFLKLQKKLGAKYEIKT